MKRTILSAALLCAAAACAAPAPPDNTNTSQPKTNANASAAASPAPAAPAVSGADALARENQLYDTLKAKNHDAFAAMLADDVLQVTAGGVYDKAAILRGVASFVPTSITMSEARVVSVDKDLYVFNYKAEIDGQADGRPLPADYVERASTAWVNRGGKWLAVYHQETIPKEPPPATAATPAAAAPAASPSASPSSTAAAATATDREKQLWALLRRGDFDAFADHLAADQLEVEPVGVFNKAQSVEGARQVDFSGATLSDFREVKLGADATLVTYVVKSSARGFHPAGERHTTIWANRGGKWLAVYHQGTEVEK